MTELQFISLSFLKVTQMYVRSKLMMSLIFTSFGPQGIFSQSSMILQMTENQDFKTRRRKLM